MAEQSPIKELMANLEQCRTRMVRSLDLAAELEEKSGSEAVARACACHDDLVAALAECEAYLWKVKQDASNADFCAEWAEGGAARALHERVKALLAKAKGE